jgi:DNA-binding NtrC family response regulator
VECIERSQFRVDLFYRLKVVSIFLPSLRKRPGDIPLLVEHFVSKYRRQSKMPIRGIAKRAQALLEAQTWTGNVRELENAIQTAVVLNRTGTLDTDDFPFLSNGARPSTLGTVDEVLERLREEAVRGAKVLLAGADSPDEESRVYHSLVDVVERAVVLAALDRTGGNQVRAAKDLGISRNTLRSKLVGTVDPVEGRS